MAEVARNRGDLDLVNSTIGYALVLGRLMIIHPPMLYCGFVGMTVPFGIAAGALLRGELGDAWLVPLRKWMLIPWTFLSVGIILGSWWAYAVLGWGGYWAWDPVENASFLPWLTATAFIHSTMVLERKKSLKLWTLALALGTFVLTIVGTFMTRSRRIFLEALTMVWELKLAV